MKLFKFLLIITLEAAVPVQLGYSAENTVTYCGSVFSGSSITEIVTNFHFSGEEELRGSYKFLENGRPVSGTLVSKEALKNRRAMLLWTDKYGEVNLAVTFSENFDSFDGKWGARREAPTNSWQGKKCESTGEPGIPL